MSPKLGASPALGTTGHPRRHAAAHPPPESLRPFTTRNTRGVAFISSTGLAHPWDFLPLRRRYESIAPTQHVCGTVRARRLRRTSNLWARALSTRRTLHAPATRASSGPPCPTATYPDDVDTTSYALKLLPVDAGIASSVLGKMSTWGTPPRSRSSPHVSPAYAYVPLTPPYFDFGPRVDVLRCFYAHARAGADPALAPTKELVLFIYLFALLLTDHPANAVMGFLASASTMAERSRPPVVHDATRLRRCTRPPPTTHKRAARCSLPAKDLVEMEFAQISEVGLAIEEVVWKKMQGSIAGWIAERAAS
ncbi:hypothetical protein GGX14DRAFT_625202 [Mycena pura]|uniref:Uncharacterized protein n=1 Tax=Mycena pura TaxID=153505 RepID=A0AAD6VIZ3_9AGAR|nr:hypothetical protein GGX14DRAFT_625202 [Mycena pura]